MAIKGLGKLTNTQLFEIAQEKSATFDSLTAKISRDEFLNGGKIGGVDATTISAIKNEFLKTVITWALGEVRGHRVKNALEAGGVGVRYYDEYTGAKQIMFVGARKPVNPQYLGLQDGDSLDQDEVRKPVVYDRFYCKNMNYSNWITIQPVMMKDAFNGPNGFGMYDVISWILADLEGKYTKEAYLTEKEVINYAINNNVDNDRLQDSQIVEVEFADVNAPTKEEMTNLINVLKDTKDAITVEDTGAFNACGFEDVQEVENLRFIARPTYVNKIETALYANAFNKDDLKTGIQMVKINNFGGLQPKDANDAALQMVYDKNGAVMGYIDANATVNGPATYKNGQWVVNITSAGVTADTTFPTEPDHWDDPNANVIGVICDYRFLEIDESNPYILRVHQNDRGLYDNYFTHKPGDGVHYRSDRNFVVIKAVQAETTEDTNANTESTKTTKTTK